MSFLSKFWGVLKRNPKKSIFFSAIITYGASFAKEKYEENEMMRQLCNEAMAYGELSKPLGETERHITVLLNPAARGGKGKLEFERYCAPLLHLAGLKVATVKTEHEGQARELMEIMDNTTAVVVAGGDGTLAEALTGLLRRPDSTEASQRLPLGILPIGQTNTVTSAIWGFRGHPKPCHLAEATMAIIRDIKRPLDVMEITPLQGTDHEVPKPVYAAASVEWGVYRDAAEKKNIYWYWSVLKNYMTYIFSSYKDISWDCSAEVEYSAPCSGCSRCHELDNQEKSKQSRTPETQRRWWMAYIPKAKEIQQNIKEEKIDYSTIYNEDCGLMHTSVKNTSDITIETRNSPHSLDLPSYALSMKTGPVNLDAFEFIKEGWKREWSKRRSYAEETIVGEVILTPMGSTKTKEGGERELNIDSEAFEVRPMKIRVKPSAVTVFAPPTPPFTLST